MGDLKKLLFSLPQMRAIPSQLTQLLYSLLLKGLIILAFLKWANRQHSYHFYKDVVEIADKKREQGTGNREQETYEKQVISFCLLPSAFCLSFKYLFQNFKKLVLCYTKSVLAIAGGTLSARANLLKPDNLEREKY